MGATEENFLEIVRLVSHDTHVHAHKTGTAINVTDDGCDVEVDGEPRLTDVRFYAIIDEVASKIVVRPKEGSKVLVGIIDGMITEAFVVQCSEIESVSLKIGEVLLFVNSDGVVVKKAEDSLMQALKLMIEAVLQIVVIYGNNPNYMKLNESMRIIQNILKDAP